MRLAHNFSIGFNSGEYGGRKIKCWLYLQAISVSLFFLWKDALSITITVSSGRYGKRHCSNQNSNSVLSVVPLYCNGAMIALPNFAATIFVRWNFRPRIFSITISPLGAYPYSRYKQQSIPVSSIYAMFSLGISAIFSRYSFTNSSFCS